jgi:hypothetical protein
VSQIATVTINFNIYDHAKIREAARRHCIKERGSDHELLSREHDERASIQGASESERAEGMLKCWLELLIWDSATGPYDGDDGLDFNSLFFALRDAE